MAKADEIEKLKQNIQNAIGTFYDAAYNAGVASVDNTPAIDALKAAHAADIAALRDEHAAELQRIIEQNEQAKNAAFDEGFKQGHAAALENLGIVTGGGQEDPEPTPEPAPMEQNIENAAVRAFIDKPYGDGIIYAGASVVDDYCLPNMREDDYAANRQEHPQAVVLGAENESGTITNGVKTWNVTGGKVWNLAPAEYTYNVGGRSGRVNVTGRVRMLHFETDNHISNCRDIGGKECEGGRVAFGRIIRSAYVPDTLAKTDPNAVILRDDVGITAEIDFNAKPKIDRGWRVYPYFIYGYADVLTKTTNVKVVFNALIKELNAGGCVLVHCTAGADRTGTFIALILALLGCSQSDIVQDYELTSFSDWCNFKRIDDERFDEFPKGELRSFFKALRKAYGKNGETLQQQAYNFLTKKIGVSAAQIAQLKSAMVIC